MAVGRALVMSRTEQDRRQEAEDRQLRQAASTAKRSSSSSSSSTPAANTRTAAAAAATATPLQQPQQAAAAAAAAATAQSQNTANSSSSSKPATAARTVVLDSETLGVGGMDHVVDAIRRRVWIPLSAPRSLLDDLGVSPVSGLLLHGPPGCGKSLLARRLSALLTPRAPTFVSGPEILDRFVGSSEANVRSLFDYPPPLPAGATVDDDEALHVIVLDEFDAIAGHRSAGGGGDGGERVRDSVVNQLLSRMDGVQQMTTPTLLVALTNRIDLIDPALLRPGRFEVHIEVSCSLHKLHIQGTSFCFGLSSTHLLCAFAGGTTASRADCCVTLSQLDNKCTYSTASSRKQMAAQTEGFSGAELAGIVRAAAAYALDRASQCGFSNAAAAKVTLDDFDRGLRDVTPSTAVARQRAASAATVTTSLAVTGDLEVLDRPNT
eukprot:20198-Heterococcus_DN1.PRE.1